MEEKIEVPVRPVNREEQYLAAILGELRAIRLTLVPPVGEPEDDLFGEEVVLRESSPSPQPSPVKGEGGSPSAR